MNVNLDVPEYIVGLDGRTLEVVDLTQNHVEDFFKARDKLKRPGASIFEINGNLVRAAAQVGILIGMEASEIGSLPARTVQWLAASVDTVMAELVQVPGPEDEEESIDDGIKGVIPPE